MNVLVMGASGYIGSHLLDSLLPDPAVHVVGFDPDVRKISEHLERPNFKLYRQYLFENGGMDALAEALEGADAVINLAAICNPSQYNTQPLATIRANCLDIYPVIDYGIDVDWADLYGPEWAVMQDREPDHVTFAAGSAVAVYPKSV